jgi:hypothetical protein
VVTVSNVHVAGDPGSFAVVSVDTGSGNDQLTVLDSSFGLLFGSLGTGDDTATLGGNTFDSAFLDGGPGYDRLSATGNTGALGWSDFEEVAVMP